MGVWVSGCLDAWVRFRLVPSSTRPFVHSSIRPYVHSAGWTSAAAEGLRRRGRARRRAVGSRQSAVGSRPTSTDVDRHGPSFADAYRHEPMFAPSPPTSGDTAEKTKYRYLPAIPAGGRRRTAEFAEGAEGDKEGPGHRRRSPQIPAANRRPSLSTHLHRRSPTSIGASLAPSTSDPSPEKMNGAYWVPQTQGAAGRAGGTPAARAGSPCTMSLRAGFCAAGWSGAATGSRGYLRRAPPLREVTGRLGLAA